MSKIKSLDDLRKRRDEISSSINLREKGEESENLVQVKIGMATCGIASGAKETFDYFNDELSKRNIDYIITQTGCMGYCHSEPTVEVTVPGEEPVVFGNVDQNKADEIIEKYIKNQELVDGVIPVSFKTIDNQ